MLEHYHFKRIDNKIKIIRIIYLILYDNATQVQSDTNPSRNEVNRLL